MYIILVYIWFKCEKHMTINTVGAFEAKTYLSAILDQVEKGEQITITKHGKPVAKLVPISNIDQKQISENIKHLKEFSKKNKITLGKVDWKTLRDEGRR
jgi:prevent-host-death family protein